MNAVEFFEIVVASVENVVSPRLDGDFLHRLGIIDRCRGDMEKGRYLGLQIVKGMYLDTTLILAELGPPEHFKA